MVMKKVFLTLILVSGLFLTLGYFSNTTNRHILTMYCNLGSMKHCYRMGYEYLHAPYACSNYDRTEDIYSILECTMQDKTKAVKFLKKACDGGYVDACTELKQD